ncbi:MAG: hypothetical protein LBD23_08700 [Oscillospiraceae bacterium]|jgi:hypothetical protein|nr:hypothetical protein [Oscillospiraceae bacterium]
MKSFEEIIISTLSGDTQKNALDFATFLKANDMIVAENNSQVIYMDKTLAYMHIDGNSEMPGPWTVWPDGDFSVVPQGYDFDDAMKKIAWAHINKCGKCGGTCAPGSDITLFGKVFDGVCNSVMAFTDPSDKALVCLKKLLLIQAS